MEIRKAERNADLYFKGVETENIEILDFIKSSEEKIKALKIELLTELNNL